MRNLLLLVATLGILAAAFAPIASAQGDDPEAKAWNRISQARRSAGLARAEANNLFGEFRQDAQGNVEGRFVGFQYAESGGVLRNLTVHRGEASLAFFSTVTPAPFVAKGASSVLGPQFRAPAQDYTLRIHNNPVALSAWVGRGGDTNLTFVLAPGAKIGGSTGRSVTIVQGASHAHLLSNGQRAIDNTTNTLTVHLGVGEVVLFVAHPPSGPASLVLHAFNELFLTRFLGSWTNVVDGGGQAILDNFEVDVKVQVSKISQGRVTFNIEGDAKDPKILVFVVDTQTTATAEADKIVVRLDGETVNKIRSTSQLLTFEAAQAYVLASESMALVLVKIPQFSSHALVIEQEGLRPEGGGLPGPSTIGGIFAVGFVAVIWVRRRP